MVFAALTLGRPSLNADAAHSPWPMYRQNQYHTGLSTVPVSGSVGVLTWKYQTGGAIHSSPAINPDGTLYIGSDDRNVYAIRPDGTLQWKYPTGAYIYSSPAVDSDGTIYVGGRDNYVYALQPGGTLKWKYPTGGEVYASPTIGPDGTIYVGSVDTYIYALHPDGTLGWRVKTGGTVYSPPAVGTDGTLYVGSFDHALYAILPGGTTQWAHQTDGTIYSSPAVAPADGAIYVGNDSHSLYALRPDGSEKWRSVTSSSVYSSPAIGPDGTVYIGSNDDKIYAFDPDSGAIKWAFPTGGPVGYGAPAIGSDGTVYIGSADSIYAVRPDSGTLKWTYHMGGVDNGHASPAIGADGTVYIGGTNGCLYAFHITTPPELSWTGEPQYGADGLNPEVGKPGTPFTFRIIYADADNDAPAPGYPKVHIQKGGMEINGSPFAMEYVSGANTTGATYTYQKVLHAGGSDYSYYFEAYDVWGATATGVPLSPMQAPCVFDMDAITPSVGYNSSPVVPVTITGAGYSTHTTISLEKTGHSPIALAVDSALPDRITGTLDLTGAATGYWDVVIATGGAGSFSVAFDTAFRYSSMTITSIKPAQGANTMLWSIANLSGEGFVPGSSIKIARAGQSDIPASGVMLADMTKFSCALDLAGAATGYWDVVVTTGGAGSVSATLPGGFFVNIIGIASISPDSGVNNAPVAITHLSGGGFSAASTVRLSKAGYSDIPASAVTVLSQSLIACTIDLTGAAPGYWDVVVSTGGPGSAYAVLRDGFLVQGVQSRIAQLLDDSADSTVTLLTAFGDVTVHVPARTFGENVVLAVSTAAVPGPDRNTLAVSDIHFGITVDKGIQPRKAMTVTVNYRGSDIAGLDEKSLLLAYYDEARMRWVTVPATVYPALHRIIGTVTHLSAFAVVALGAAPDLAHARAYPIPYTPRRGTMTFDNLTDDATIKIFTITGQLIRTAGPPAANGRVAWDGSNDAGTTIASGIYIVLIQDSRAIRTFKIAIEK